MGSRYRRNGHMTSIIAVDIGTTRIKCARFDAQGHMSCLRQYSLPRAASPNRQDATVWRSTAEAFLREAAHEGPIDAIAVTGNMHAMLPVNADGTPLVDAWLWSDNASTTETETLNRTCRQDILNATCNVPAPVFTLPKILRFRRECPQLYNQTAAFLQSKEVVIHALTGLFVTDPVDASGSLLFDIRNNTWNSALLRELKLDADKLPQLHPSASVCGTVSREAAARLCLRSGTPVVTGCGDLASAAVGSGVSLSRMSLTLGTAGQLLAAGKHGDGKALAKRLFVFAHADPALELFLGSVPSGGFSFEWLASLHNIPITRFFDEAESACLTAQSPLFFPYLLGRGAPYMDYTPCAAWQGLAASQTRPELFAAAVFGTLCPLRQCADLLESLSHPRSDIVLQALAARQQAVQNTAAALFNHRGLLLPSVTEASLAGIAVIAAVAIGEYPSFADATAAMLHFTHAPTPTTNNALTIDALYARFLACAAQIDKPEG